MRVPSNRTSGARCNAILSLTWDRVELDHDLVILPRRGLKLPQANGGRADECDTSRSSCGVCELAETDWVIEFRRPVGRIVNGFKKGVTRSGIAACTIPDLRRTAASFAQVAAYLGDTDEVIRRHYGMSAPDWLRAAAESRDT